MEVEQQQLRDQFIAKYEFTGLPIADQINKQRLRLTPTFLMKLINKTNRIQQIAEELTNSILQQEKFIDAIEQEQQLLTSNNNNNNCGTKRSFNTMNQQYKNIQNPYKKQRLITKIPNTKSQFIGKNMNNNTQTIHSIINAMNNKKGIIFASDDRDCNKMYSNLQNNNISCLVYNEKTTNKLSKWIENKNNKYQILITTIQMGINILKPDIKFILTSSNVMVNVLKQSQLFVANSNTYLIWKSNDFSMNIKPMISNINNIIELVIYIIKLMYLHENICAENGISEYALLIYKIINKSKYNKIKLNVQKLMDIWSTKSFMGRQHIINRLFINKYVKLNAEYGIMSGERMLQLVKKNSNKSNSKKQNKRYTYAKLIHYKNKAKQFYNYAFDYTNWFQMNMTENKRFWKLREKENSSHNYVILDNTQSVVAILFFDSDEIRREDDNYNYRLELQTISKPNKTNVIINALKKIIPKIFNESNVVNEINMNVWSRDIEGIKIAKALGFKFEEDTKYRVTNKDIKSPGVDISMFNPLDLNVFKLPVKNFVLHKQF